MDDPIKDPAEHIELRVCPVCDCAFDVDLDIRGQARRMYCTDQCNRKAFQDRKSAAKQSARRLAVKPCATCGAVIPVRIRGPVGRWCSTACSEVARGQRRESPLPAIECALPGCDEVFVPMFDTQRCCSEQHGKNLYNRESRADGRQQPEAWTDARRDRYHRRRALKKAATTGRPVRRAEIAARDGYACGICKAPVAMDAVWPDPLSPSLDHVVPLARGGVHDPLNVQLAHLGCNSSKGDRLTQAERIAKANIAIREQVADLDRQIAAMKELG